MAERLIMDKIHSFLMNPVAKHECMVQGDTYRISILTDRLIRLEYSISGQFEDCATQTVLNRNFDIPNFRVWEKKDKLEIITEELQIVYDRKAFSANGLSIRLIKGIYSNCSIWRYGDKGGNLKGTARTLDTCDGETGLEDGVLGRTGYAVLDDSASLALTADGWVRPALSGHTDLYFFGYGHNYRECMKDFFRLCGATPLLPRYVLGNWWSRYHAYTQDEYMQLMDRFQDENIPFSVAVLDMDWHHVKLDEKYGNGWTGYTWNEELFPNHEEMLKELHHRGLHVTLNVHPADGVRGHEKAYREMAEALGVEFEKEVPIPFNISDPEFLKAYFRYLHHPLENEGVDFWWIDWQQGTASGIPGLDPLWMLNHYHFRDSEKENRRPLIFSRYAGIGSHRYPIGFSGDTVITWKSLAFQPYFTSTASNIGYGWWSHDIGGHMDGYRDDELAVRWVQFGVFSPIMRLHSSSSRFTGKEPWNFGEWECGIIKKFLRLRHAMIPYLYTMNARAHFEGEALVQPMYYRYSDDNRAYDVRNQYFFGTEMMVHPITSKMDMTTKMGKVTTWLPQGMWYDLFTGLIYQGDKMVCMYRPLETIPVLAKAGAIIPLQREEITKNSTENPKDMVIIICTGENGEFVLYEDDGISMDFKSGRWVGTRYQLRWGSQKRFTISPACGLQELIPAYRNYQLKFMGISAEAVLGVRIDGRIVSCETNYDDRRNIQTIELTEVSVNSEICIEIDEEARGASNKIEWRVSDCLNKSQIEYRLKDEIYDMVTGMQSLNECICNLNALEIPKSVKEMIQEIILA